MVREYLKAVESPARAVILLSGGGSNAEQLLRRWQDEKRLPWRPAVLATDRPETSRTRELAERYGVPWVAVDIRAFYRERGEERVSISTERGQAIREEWTTALRAAIAPYRPDFGVLAGFVPLTNLTADFPCLNVHPGDLTVEDAAGRRLLVGLHTIPVERAILEGFASLRSSVIVAQPYTGRGGEMDTGPVLGVSAPVAADLQGRSVMELQAIAAQRSGKRPAGGWRDELESIAAHNQERLKEGGDWVVFPPVVEDFAAGRFGVDESDHLHYRTEAGWLAIRTVEYSDAGRSIRSA
jgi:folate-dependent phosphoribosylglycinamide formyltransferase PurN